jgi:hypothetical protein
MSYHHIDIIERQSSKKPNAPCGDAYGVMRSEYATTVVLSDGLGSGVKANVAANLCVSRVLGLIKNGATLREAFSSMVRTMNKVWGTISPFAVFNILQVLNNGDATVLSYESPQPILIGPNNAYILSDRVYTLEKSLISEVNTKIEMGEGILLMTDGITQAGLGNGLANGWETEGVLQYIRQFIHHEDVTGQHVVEAVHRKALNLWGNNYGDDCSVLLAKSRSGIVVNILTGPPANSENDRQLVQDFHALKGIKIICGGVSAKIVAKQLGKQLKVDTHSENAITPPAYSIDGMNIVSEGIVTLNQVYNILDEDVSKHKSSSKVFQIAEFMQMADRINFFGGEAQNKDEHRIEFRQQGILHRKEIVGLISEKLQKMGKLIVHYKY